MKSAAFPPLANLSPFKQFLGQGNLLFKEAGSIKFLLHLRI